MRRPGTDGGGSDFASPRQVIPANFKRNVSRYFLTSLILVQIVVILVQIVVILQAKGSKFHHVWRASFVRIYFTRRLSSKMKFQLVTWRG